jgi:hypothetical protein
MTTTEQVLTGINWEQLDKTPQRRVLSTNVCPNAGPMFLRGWDCSPYAITTFGYCLACWRSGKVPPAWTS